MSVPEHHHSLQPKRFLVLGALVSCGLVIGCGLVDLASLSGITFDLPRKSFSVSTQDPRFKQPPANFPPLLCGAAGMVMDCCKPPPPLQNMCDRYPIECDNATCALKFNYEVASRIDLAKEVPTLSSAQGRVLSKVTLKNLEVTVSNHLSIAVPEIKLYAAPDGVITTTNQARLLGTIPGKPVMYEGTESLMLDAAGQENFSAFARDFLRPFNIIASTTVVIQSGSAPPSGKVDFAISGKVEAKF